jgi:hypothetical protein
LPAALISFVIDRVQRCDAIAQSRMIINNHYDKIRSLGSVALLK